MFACVWVFIRVLYLPSHDIWFAFKEYPTLQKQYSTPPGLTPHFCEQLSAVFVHSVFAEMPKRPHDFCKKKNPQNHQIQD